MVSNVRQVSMRHAGMIFPMVADPSRSSFEKSKQPQSKTFTVKSLSENGEGFCGWGILGWARR
jgi:hypothetical protein